jgi:hypothetical protein
LDVANSQRDDDLAALSHYLDGQPDLTLATDTILKGLIDDRTVAAANRAQTAEHLNAGTAQSVGAQTAIQLAEQAVTNEEQAIAREMSDLAARIDDAEAGRIRLPSAWQPRLDDDVPSLQDLFSRLRENARELVETSAVKDRALALVLAATRDLAALVGRRQTEVDGPARLIVRRLSALVERLATAAKLVGDVGPDALAEAAPLLDLAACAEKIRTRAYAISKAVVQAVNTAREETNVITSSGREILAQVEIDSSEALQSALEAAAGEVLRWEAAEVAARA